MTVTQAELHAMRALADRYSEAYNHLLTEQQTAERLPSAVDLAARRVGDLLSTPATRAQYAAYLDGLELTHGTDRAMRAVIDEGRARLAAAEHSGAAPDGPPARTPPGPDHTPPADIHPRTSTPDQEAAA
ncbi:hypothetical protein [Actinomadura luteofluorescens]|uniref:hypothetical protein n=1 Tax=Actinomadura luteofluorescens TaxID=46163 RepID=UPI003D949D3E